MKVDVGGGKSLIAGTSGKFNSGFHDAFPSHTPDGLSALLAEFAASGQFFLFRTFGLLDGNLWWYPFASGDFVAINNLALLTTFSSSHGFPQPCEGLFWNYGQRQMVFDKVLDADLGLWLSTH